MTINLITIILTAAVILFAVLSSFINPFARRAFLKHQDKDKNVEDGDLPPLTVIIPTHENAEDLELLLPRLLSQDYPNFKIIVVQDEGDSETEDVLKRIGDNPRLYNTFIPRTSRYMSRLKLAITLGVKAAKSEWILLLSPLGLPESDQFFKLLARHCAEDVNLVMGFSKYEDAAKPYYRFDQMLTSCYLFRTASIGTAYRTNSSALLFRKSDFMKGNGYNGNLDLIHGEYDFIVNKYARSHSTETELSEGSMFIEKSPSRKMWRDKRVVYMETRRHLKRSFSNRILFNLDQLMLHLNVLFILFLIAYSIITQRWLITIGCALAIIISYNLRVWLSRFMLNSFRVKLSPWKIPFYEWSVLWHNMANINRYKRADRNEFTTHKQ